MRYIINLHIKYIQNPAQNIVASSRTMYQGVLRILYTLNFGSREYISQTNQLLKINLMKLSSWMILFIIRMNSTVQFRMMECHEILYYDPIY